MERKLRVGLEPPVRRYRSGGSPHPGGLESGVRAHSLRASHLCDSRRYFSGPTALLPSLPTD
eukprot:8568741-Lingulodinium_polyedra.AAC.1